MLRIAVALLLSSALPAAASVVDLGAVGSGKTKGALTLPDLGVLSGAAGSFYVYKRGEFGMSAFGGFCGLNVSFKCLADVTLTLARPIEALSFLAYFVAAGDRAVITAYSGDAVVGVETVTSNRPVAFSSLLGITKVVFDDRSDARTKGIAYGGLSYVPYTPPPPAAVPLPGGLPLLGAALLSGLVLGRFRAKGGAAGR